MSRWTRVSQGETTIDFVGLRRRWFVISAVLLVTSLGSLAIRQLNLGLEFVGGVAVQVENPQGADIADVRQVLAPLGLGGARIQLLDEGASVLVQTEPLDEATEDQMIEAIVSITGVDRQQASIEAVGPTFGALVARQAVIALLVFLGFAVLFIAWRLQWKMAIAGIAALIHDLVITVGVYSVTGFEVTPATVVAILTILGYSLYDTVVVFDKVEENEDSFHDEFTYTDIVNRSMNQVLVRSLATSFTSLIPVGSLLFVGGILLGAASLQDFALALFVGIAAGTYSSIFVAAPLLATWREREPLWMERRAAIESGTGRKRRTGAAAPAPAGRQSAAEPAEPAESIESPPARPAARQATPRPPKGAQPRPPKKRR
jgi:preprotein translocase subunit SecF